VAISGDEKHRLMCELRQWVAWGYSTTDKIAQLEIRIAKKRGMEAAKTLSKQLNWYIAKKR